MARTYRVTVNGKAYDVNVEEITNGVQTPAAPVQAAPAAPAPVQTPAPAAAP